MNDLHGDVAFGLFLLGSIDDAHTARAELFADVPVGQRMALRPLLERAIGERRLGARRWTGRWVDVGTAERLAQANADLHS